jgi:hypothetical protein
MKTIRIVAVAVLIVASIPALRVVKAQQAGAKRTELQRHDLSVRGREVIQVRVDLEPGVSFPSHTHPGEEIIYVLEGTCWWQACDGQRRRRPVRPGWNDPFSQERWQRERGRTRNLSRRERTAASHVGQIAMGCSIHSMSVLMTSQVQKGATEMKVRQITASLIVTALIFVVTVLVRAQDRFTLTSPDGIKFSEFRGYDAWQVIAPSQLDGGVKSIVGNSVMIKAFSDGIPANGQSVPDGAVMAKIEWSAKDNPDLKGAARVPDALKNVGFMIKDAKRFPDTNGWGYAQFNYDAGSGTFKPLGSKPGFAKAACHQCHTVVKDRDYVFSKYALR